METEHGMRLVRHNRGNPETEYVEAYPTAPPLDSTRAVKACAFPQVRVLPGRGRMPSSNRSGGGGNELVGAFGGKGRPGDSAKMQAVTQVND